MKPITPEDIDAILPQTQCGLCGYAGCLPYARALITENAPPNLCPPGGIETLKEIGNLLRQDISPYLASMLETEKKPAAAIIREQECIGCTKCIQVCPVDAIIGSAKNMHSIIRDECTGCELCVPACPVDCIDLENLGVLSKQQQQQKRITARMRFQARNKRLENAKRTELTEKKVSDDRKKYIREAIARTKAKKNIV